MILYVISIICVKRLLLVWHQEVISYCWCKILLSWKIKPFLHPKTQNHLFLNLIDSSNVTQKMAYYVFFISQWNITNC